MWLSEDLRAAIEGAVEGAYPEEGCGIVTERRTREWCVHVSANRAAHPERAYVLDERVLLRAAGRGERLCWIFHSHPEGEAVFSARDQRGALLDGGGRVLPAFPGVGHVVVSVVGGRARRSGAFHFDAEAGRYVEVASWEAVDRE